MFRKYYKAANDDIKPNRELIDEIFRKAELGEIKPARVYSFGKRYGTAVAAVLVLAVSALVYPQLERMNETPKIVPKTNLIQVENTDITGKEVENKVVEKAETTGEEQKELKADASEIAKLNDAAEIQPETIEAENGVNGSIADQQPQADTSVENIDFVSPMMAEYQEEQGFEISDKTDMEKGAVSGGGSSAVGGGGSSRSRSAVTENQAVELAVEDIETVDMNDAESAVAFLLERFGKTDMETGNDFIFEIAGTAEVDGESYFVGRWRWLTQNGNSSLLTEFVLNEAFTEMYEFSYGSDGKLQWNKENNLIK